MTFFKRLIHEAHRRSLWQVLGIYLLGAWFAYEVVLALVEGLGLPDWVPPFAVVLIVIGLPIVLATAFVQEGVPDLRRSDERIESLLNGIELIEEDVPYATPSAASVRPTGSFLERHLTWGRAVRGGVLAFALLGLATTGFMGMRQLGVGGAATLFSSGALEEGAPILLAEFAAEGVDPLLADAVTRALRVDLENSRAVRVYEEGRVKESLARMQRAPDTRIDEAVARDLAQREGLKAVIVGEVTGVGGVHVLTARVITPDSGRVLTSARERATDAAEVIDAVDRLSAALRERIGESLRTIRTSEPLAQVTTGSLAALQKYEQALRVWNDDPEHTRALALLEEALAIDPSFAMAWRKVGAAYQNRDDRARTVLAMTRAYEMRDRLPDRERYAATGSYMLNVPQDLDAAIRAQQALVGQYPDDVVGWHNLGLALSYAGRHAEAAEASLRSIEVNNGAPLFSTYLNLMGTQVELGRIDEAARTVASAQSVLPDQPGVKFLVGALTRVRGDITAAEGVVREMARTGPPGVAGFAGEFIAETLEGTGRLDAGERERHALAEQREREGRPEGAYQQLISAALARLVIAGDEAGARALVEEALARWPIDGLPVLNRPHGVIAFAYALAGERVAAERHLARLLGEVRPTLPRAEYPDELRARFILAVDAGETARAEALLRELEATPDFCGVCKIFERGFLFDQLGQVDSAAAAFERLVEHPGARGQSFLFYGPALERLAQIRDGQGRAADAVRYYARLVELWQNADPELRPRVDSARRRIAALGGRPG